MPTQEQRDSYAERREAAIERQKERAKRKKEESDNSGSDKNSSKGGSGGGSNNVSDVSRFRQEAESRGIYTSEGAIKSNRLQEYRELYDRYVLDPRRAEAFQRAGISSPEVIQPQKSDESRSNYNTRVRKAVESSAQRTSQLVADVEAQKRGRPVKAEVTVTFLEQKSKQEQLKSQAPQSDANNLFNDNYTPTTLNYNLPPGMTQYNAPIDQTSVLWFPDSAGDPAVPPKSYGPVPRDGPYNYLDAERIKFDMKAESGLLTFKTSKNVFERIEGFGDYVTGKANAIQISALKGGYGATIGFAGEIIKDPGETLITRPIKFVEQGIKDPKGTERMIVQNIKYDPVAFASETAINFAGPKAVSSGFFLIKSNYNAFRAARQLKRSDLAMSTFEYSDNFPGFSGQRNLGGGLADDSLMFKKSPLGLDQTDFYSNNPNYWRLDEEISAGGQSYGPRTDASLIRPEFRQMNAQPIVYDKLTDSVRKVDPRGIPDLFESEPGRYQIAQQTEISIKELPRSSASSQSTLLEFNNQPKTFKGVDPTTGKLFTELVPGTSYIMQNVEQIAPALKRIGRSTGDLLDSTAQSSRKVIQASPGVLLASYNSILNEGLSKQDSRNVLEMTPALKEKTLMDVDLRKDVLTITRTAQSQSLEKKQEEGLVLNLKLKRAQALKQDQLLDVQQEEKQKTMPLIAVSKFKQFNPRSPVTPRSDFPKVPGLPRIRLPEIRDNEKIDTFDLFVRKRGRFVPFGSFEGYESAFKEGADIVDTSASASFKIFDDTGAERNNIPNQFKKQFRRSRKDKNILVEKEIFRINTPGEKAEIPGKSVLLGSKRKKGRGGFFKFF